MYILVTSVALPLFCQSQLTKYIISLLHRLVLTNFTLVALVTSSLIVALCYIHM